MSTSRTALIQAMQGQQKTIEGLSAKIALQDVLIDHIANLAGISTQVTAIRKKADVENPAQPVPDPNPEGPSETTQEAVTPEAYDDVRNPGTTPNSLSHVPAEATTVALQPGADLPTSPVNELVDPQAPIEGTQTQIPLDQTRIETDVRVGDPMNQETAFPWNMGENRSNGERTASANSESRMIASMRLARLQIEQGIEEGDDLSLGQRIASSNASEEEINKTIDVLSSVKKAAAKKQSRPAHLVPRTASSEQRATPSFAGGGISTTASTPASTMEDTADADLFD